MAAAGVTPAHQAVLLGKQFFPNLISAPFKGGLRAVFLISAAMCIIAAITSALRGQRVILGVTAQAGGLPAGADAALPTATAVVEPSEDGSGTTEPREGAHSRA